MKTLAILCALLVSAPVLGQITFPVADFSPDYIGKVQVTDTSGVFRKGWVAIYDKHSGKELIKVRSNELAFELHDGRVQANINQLPYGEESVIIYQDLNFDGVKDFAIMDGMNSGYHLPSFNIYLAEKAGFRYSKEFSRLAHENTGMFDVDSTTKMLYTMAKSGCCWHQTKSYAVKNNKPQTMRVSEIDQNNQPFEVLTLKEWNGKKWITKVERSFDTTDLNMVLFFEVAKNNKHVVLFEHDQQLNYALLDTAWEVEFSYPVETDEETPGFLFDTTSGNLSVTFQNRSANYHVFENAGKVGVEAITKGVLYTQDGDMRSVRGSLKNLLKMKLENLVIR